jgi:hypothetical protein
MIGSKMDAAAFSYTLDGTRPLAAQHLELVAQDRDLDVFGMLALEPPEQDAEKPAHHEVEEG